MSVEQLRPEDSLALERALQKPMPVRPERSLSSLTAQLDALERKVDKVYRLALVAAAAGVGAMLVALAILVITVR
jgi:hypothetical protein